MGNVSPEVKDSATFSPSQARQLFGEIRESCRNGEKAGTKIRLLRERLGFSPTKFSAELGVSRQTLERWEKDKVKPKASTLESIATLLPKGTGEEKLLLRLGIRMAEYVLELEREASEVWVFRTQTLYETLYDQFHRAVLSNLLNGVSYSYFFPKRSKADKSAESLFARMRIDIANTTREPGHHVKRGTLKKYCIAEESLAFEFGLSPAPIPTDLILIRYDANKRNQSSKSYDLFIHLPVAVYNDEDKRDLELTGNYSIWIELPQHQASEVFQYWEEIILKNKAATTLEITEL